MHAGKASRSQGAYAACREKKAGGPPALSLIAVVSLPAGISFSIRIAATSREPPSGFGAPATKTFKPGLRSSLAAGTVVAGRNAMAAARDHHQPPSPTYGGASRRCQFAFLGDQLMRLARMYRSPGLAGYLPKRSGAADSDGWDSSADVTSFAFTRYLRPISRSVSPAVGLRVLAARRKQLFAIIR
jgi:hypothetical protein